MSDTSKATVTVVAREGFNGFWSAGRHFGPGENLVELTAAEQAAIEADAALGLPISVVAGWPAPKLSPEEQAAALAASEEAALMARMEAEEQAAAAAKKAKK